MEKRKWKEGCRHFSSFPPLGSYIMFLWKQSRGGHKQAISSLRVSAAQQPLSTARKLVFCLSVVIVVVVVVCICKHTGALCVFCLLKKIFIRAKMSVNLRHCVAELPEVSTEALLSVRDILSRT